MNIEELLNNNPSVEAIQEYVNAEAGRRFDAWKREKAAKAGEAQS